ncbi:hypothetical protein E2320_002365, partial [Naja naja]
PDTLQNMHLMQIVKSGVVKILHHCLLGCLKNEDQMDGLDEKPVCKKSKTGNEDQQHTDTSDDSASEEGDMSETQTAEEGEPSEDSDSLNTPDAPDVYLESVQSCQRNVQHYRAVEYYEHYRFVNMEHICSFTQPIDVIHNEIQRLLNRISREIRPNDFVQLQLDAEELSRPLFSVRRPLDELNALQIWANGKALW